MGKNSSKNEENLIHTRYNDPFLAKGILKKLQPCEKCGSKEFTVDPKISFVYCKSCGNFHDNISIYEGYPKYHWCDGSPNGEIGETQKELKKVGKNTFYCVKCKKCGKKVEIHLSKL